MKKIKLSTSNIINLIGQANVDLIKGLTIKLRSVPSDGGFILLLSLDKPTGGHSGILAFGRASGHMGSSFSFHVGNYSTTMKTTWSNSTVKFYSVKKNGIEYIAVYKDAAIIDVQLLTFYSTTNSVLEYASQTALTDVVEIV